MKVLIIDDETNIQRTTSIAIKTIGHEALSAFNGEQALKKLEKNRVQAAFLDLRLGSESGLDVYDKIRAYGYEMPVIMFTAYSSIETAIEATRKGVFDYVTKPFVPEQIQQVLKKVEDQQSLTIKVRQLESQLADSTPKLTFISNNPEVYSLYEIAAKAAKSDASILLLGASGTGKTLVAKYIHEKSNRNKMSFVTVHCPSLSRELLESELFGHVKGSFTGAITDTWGKVEAAEGGTLFLDEIGELPLELQAKLLRLLQDRNYERVGETITRSADVRILAATNKNLSQEVIDGEFRKDLFYRLNVISLTLPGLEERKCDIPHFIETYVDFYTKKFGKKQVSLDADAMRALQEHNWPGNLRELNNAIERSLILCHNDRITVDDLPVEIRNTLEISNPSPLQNELPLTLEELKNTHIKQILARSDKFDIAAETLGIDTATLYRKRKILGLI